jgi:hypothetical protein
MVNASSCAATGAARQTPGLKKRHGINLVATSNSWSGGGFSQGLQAAIERANAADILFITAAGNDTYNCETSACFQAGHLRTT